MNIYTLELLPEILLSIGALAILIFSSFTNVKIGSIKTAVITLLCMTAAITLFCCINFIIPYRVTFIHVDKLSFCIRFMILIFAIFSLLLSSYDNSHIKSEHYAIMLLSLVGMLLIPYCQDFITLIVSLEIMMLSVYTMIAFSKIKENIEVALKYFIFGTIVLAWFLYSISWYYGASGSLNIFNCMKHIDFTSIAIAGSIVMILFKLGAWPFHTWVPDVYKVTKSPGLLLIATCKKLAAFALVYTLLRFLPNDLSIETLLQVLGLSSIGFGTLLAFKQSDYMRMLGYSAVTHTGWILLALSLETKLGIITAFSYLIAYLVASLIAISGFKYASFKQDNENISILNGLYQKHPALGLSISLAMLSMAGVPPFLGFYPKLWVLQQLFVAKHILIAVGALLFAVISLAYYLRVVKNIILISDDSSVASYKPEANISFWFVSVTLVVFSLMPSIFLDNMLKSLF